MSDLVLGRIKHARNALAGHAHQFSYAWFGMVVRYPIRQRGRWFAHNRFALLSFNDRDHGWRDGSDALLWLQSELDAAGLTYRVQDLRVEVLTMPRVLGFVFNPVSFWFLSNSSDELLVVVAEVNNTFKQTHSYVLHRHGESITPDHWIDAPKQFYVSPFFEVAGAYRFRFLHEPERILVRLLHLDDEHNVLLATYLGGKRHPLSRSLILRNSVAALVGVLMTLTRIHLQALVLWMKGNNLVPRPVSGKPTIKRNV